MAGAQARRTAQPNQAAESDTSVKRPSENLFSDGLVVCTASVGFVFDIVLMFGGVGAGNRVFAFDNVAFVRIGA